MTYLSQIPYVLFVGLTYVTMLMVLVAAHEYGHYVFARLFGMGAEEFSIGMFGRKPIAILGRRTYAMPVRPGEDVELTGDQPNVLEGGGATVPPIVEKTTDGRTILRETTLFTVRPWPVGGFVRIKGMMPQEDGGEVRIPGGFFSKAPWKRLVVLAAGPAFSVLAGIVLLIPYLMFYGEPKPTTMIGEAPKNGAAFKAGLRAGDRVVSIDGDPVSSWYGMIMRVRDHGDRPIAVVVDRKGKSFATTFRGDLDKTPKPVVDSDGFPTGKLRRQVRLGVTIQMDDVPVPFTQAASTAIKIPVFAAVDFVDRIVHPSTLVESVGGPGSMIKATSDSIREGFWPVIRLAALLSISVGIFNLMPIPPLDGGQMWIAFVEMLRRGRRLSMQTQVRVLNVGLAMVGVLIAGVLAIDFTRLTGITPSPKVANEKR